MVERIRVAISWERDWERDVERESGVRAVLVGKADFALSEVRLSNSGVVCKQ
jgi:hypothetical protein